MSDISHLMICTSRCSDLELQVPPNIQCHVNLYLETTLDYNIPTALNHIIRTPQEVPIAYYGFFPEQTTFGTTDALLHIMDIFEQYPEVQGIYADINQHYKHNSHTIYKQLCFPTMNPTTLSRFIINSPLFVRNNMLFQFNEKDNYIYLIRLLRTLCQNHIIWHIARPLFVQYTTKQYELNLQAEMKAYVTSQQA